VDKRKAHDIQRLLLPPLSLKVDGKGVTCVVILAREGFVSLQFNYGEASLCMYVLYSDTCSE
jgi:hypothetical protein